MPIDACGRRLRFERTPKDTGLVLKERDYALFEAIHRHGPLPAQYLYEFTKSHHRSELHLKHRLTKLYHGLTDGTHFLERPPLQYQSFRAKAQMSIYDVAPAAKTLLAEAGRLSPFIGERTDPFVHRLMAACVSASIELTCKKIGIRYIHRHDIFNHARCPELTRQAKNPLALPVRGKHLIPDDLFGLDYGGKFRFFAVEVDRNTESINRKSPDQNAVGRKFSAYVDVLADATFKRVWGIPNLFALMITTNETHLNNLVDCVRRIGVSQQEKFLFKAKPEFGINWKVPTVMEDLLCDTWARTSTPFAIDRT